MLNLQKFLKENEWNSHEELESLMGTLNIRVSFDDGLILFKYSIDADFFNPIVKECRGIILYEDTLEIACYPFNKFGNYNEPYADDIDWKTCRVQDKLDGSIMKVWFDKRENKQCWRLSTNGTIDASKAFVDNSKMTFKELFEQSNSVIDYSKLDNNKTYMFELTSPYNRVVIRYYHTDIWHIGTRDNITLEECNDDIGIQKPKEYPLTSLNEVRDAIEKLNDGDDYYEGFVVVDKNYNRIKVKTLFYINAHYIKDNIMRPNNIESCLELILNNDIYEIIGYLPELAHIIKYYDYKFSEFKYNLSRFIFVCELLWDKVNHDQKQFALKIKDHKLSSFGFRHIKTNDDINTMISNLRLSQLAKYIEPYENINNISYREFLN